MKFKSLILCALFTSGIAHAAEKVIKLATLDWQPYIGKDLKENGLVALII